MLSIFLSITRGIRPGLALGHGMRRACLERGRKPHFCDGGPDCVLSRAPSARGWGGGVAPKSGRRRNKKTGQWPVQTDSVLLSHQADPSLEGNNGVADGARTHDNRNHNPGLYQLSYSHHSCFRSSTRPFNRRTFDGAPDRIRTCDLCLRRAALYPAELRALRCRTGRIIDDDADLVYSFFDTKNQVPVFQSLPTLFNYFCFVQAGSSNSPLLFESLTP